jgi:hypothetical protein
LQLFTPQLSTTDLQENGILRKSPRAVAVWR